MTKKSVNTLFDFCSTPLNLIISCRREPLSHSLHVIDECKVNRLYVWKRKKSEKKVLSFTIPQQILRSRSLIVEFSSRVNKFSCLMDNDTLSACERKHSVWSDKEVYYIFGRKQSSWQNCVSSSSLSSSNLINAFHNIARWFQLKFRPQLMISNAQSEWNFPNLILDVNLRLNDWSKIFWFD